MAMEVQHQVSLALKIILFFVKYDFEVNKVNYCFISVQV